MEEIVTSIRRVTDIMSEITAASVEQSQGIEQVNTAITQMDEVTQQNAALVEEAAAAAESLEEQAQSLSASVATFKVDNNAGRVAATREPTTARQVTAPERKALTDHSRKAITPHKVGANVAKPKPKAGESDDGDWKEF
jgi:methyl-accepting chemotaxis protein